LKNVAHNQIEPRYKAAKQRRLVGSGDGAWDNVLVSIPCHLEPYVRFSLIRLSDSLLPVACTFPSPHALLTCHIRPASNDAPVWLSGIVCADLLVSFLWVLLALPGMHHHLRSRLTRLKQGSFPPARLCCPCYHQYYEPLRLLIRLLSEFRFISLYQRLRWVWTIDRMRPLLFRRLLSPHPVPSTPGSSSALPIQGLHAFRGLRYR
jgi:hypothetical protein